MADTEQTKTWMYSLIEYRANHKDLPIVFGVILFQPDADFLVQFAQNPASHLPDEARFVASARMLVKRLLAYNPRTTEEVNAFIAKEANEMSLSPTRSYIVNEKMTAIENLRALSFLHFLPQ
jgi:hypothetical protein